MQKPIKSESINTWDVKLFKDPDNGPNIKIYDTYVCADTISFQTMGEAQRAFTLICRVVRLVHG